MPGVLLIWLLSVVRLKVAVPPGPAHAEAEAGDAVGANSIFTGMGTGADSQGPFCTLAYTVPGSDVILLMLIMFVPAASAYQLTGRPVPPLMIASVPGRSY